MALVLAPYAGSTAINTTIAAATTFSQHQLIKAVATVSLLESSATTDSLAIAATGAIVKLL